MRWVVVIISIACASWPLGCGPLRRRPRTDIPNLSTPPRDFPRLVPPQDPPGVRQTASELGPPRKLGTSDEWIGRNSARNEPQAETDLLADPRPEVPARPKQNQRRPSRVLLDHASDYSWIQGKLEYSALAGGVWKVRYAPLSADDPHGGSVVLVSPPGAWQFHSGEFIYVEGRVLPTEGVHSYYNARYQVTHAELVESQEP